MAFNIRFDKDVDSKGGTNFDGTPATDFYAEDFLLGPNPSKKFRRSIINGKGDDEFSEITLGDLGPSSIEKGYNLRYTSNGVEITETIFDGLKKAALYKIDFDYNVEDGYLFNSIIDGASYGSEQNPNTWEEMSFLDIFNDLFVEHKVGDVSNPGQLSTSDIEFDSTEFIGAIGLERADSYAGKFSFRKLTTPQIIDQIVKREGNALWWVEFNSETNKWKIKFAKRSLTGTDPHYAKTDTTHLTNGDVNGFNVIGLDIKGAGSENINAARVIDKGRGWKFQVGGPSWLQGSTGGILGTLPPVQFQLDFEPLNPPAQVENRWIKNAIAKAAQDAGYGSNASIYQNYGWSSLSCTISDARESSVAADHGNKVRGFHSLPSKSGGSIDKKLSIDIVTPMAPEPTQFEQKVTKWIVGEDFPSKPTKPNSSNPVDDPWRIDRKLLTHPNYPFALEVQYSRPPKIVKIEYIDVTDDDIRSTKVFSDLDDENKIYERGDKLWSESALPDAKVAQAFVVEHSYTFNQRSMVAMAQVLFFEPDIQGVSLKGKIDTLGANLIYKAVDFNAAGDWSAVGRIEGTNLPDSIINWVNDTDKFPQASLEKPKLNIFIGIEDAFNTKLNEGSFEWGQKFIFHGVYTTSVPAQEFGGGTSAVFETESGDYEVHNVIFNASKTDGYVFPIISLRDDQSRMLERAKIIRDKTTSSQSIKGKYTVYPGDNVNIKVGMFTNGGMIVKVRHDYQPYHRTTFWLETSEDIDELIEPVPRDEIGDIKSELEVLTNKMKNAEREAAEAAASLSGQTTDSSVGMSPGSRGDEHSSITAGIEIKSKGDNTTNTDVENSPDLVASGFGRQGTVDLNYDNQSGRFFSGGLTIDQDPDLGRFERPNNFGSPILAVIDKNNPANNQKIGYAQNAIDIIQSAVQNGYNNSDRWRMCLNIRQSGDVLTDAKLDNFGGDRINVGDMYYVTGGILKQERKGEITGYVTNNIYFTRRLDGTAGSVNSSLLGLSRETVNGSSFDFLDGAIVGLSKTVGGAKNYEFGINLSLDNTSGSNFARDYIDPDSKHQGMRIGPGATVDQVGGKNYDYYLRLDATGGFFSSPDVWLDLGGTTQTGTFQRHLRDFRLGVIHAEWSVNATDLISGQNYIPFVGYSIDAPEAYNNASGRKFVQTHTTTNSSTAPDWQINHGTPIGFPSSAKDVIVQLTEEASSVGTGNGLPGYSIKSPKFRVRSAGEFIITGDANSDMLLYTGTANIFAGQFNGQKPLFKVNTDPTGTIGWVPLVADLTCTASETGGTTLIWLDSNDDEIGRCDIAGGGGGITWPQGCSITATGHTFTARTGTINEDSRIFIPDNKIDLLGVDVGIVGGIFAVSTNKIPKVSLSGDMTATNPYATITALCEALTSLVESHNLLVDNIRDFETVRGVQSAAIWGGQSSTATGAAVKFDRNIDMFSGNFGGTASNWKWFSTDSSMIFGRKASQGTHGNVDSGLSLGSTGLTELTTGSIAQPLYLVSGIVGGSDRNEILLQKTLFNAQIFTSQRGGTYGLLFGAGFVPSGYDIGGLTRPIVFSLRCEVNPGTLGNRLIKIWWRDVDDQDIAFTQCIIPPGGTGPAGPKGSTGPPGTCTCPQQKKYVITYGNEMWWPPWIPRNRRRGPRGRRGARGARGGRGPRGVKGKSGPTGKTGKTGASGPTGPTGKTGSRGSKGSKGDQGGGSGVPCCVQAIPVDPMIMPEQGNKFILTDLLGFQETMTIVELLGSYDLDANNSVATTPTVTKTFETITNENMILGQRATAGFIDVRSDEGRGVEFYIEPLPPLDDAGDPLPLQPYEQADSEVESGLVTEKSPAPTQPDLDQSLIKKSVARPVLPEIALDAVTWASQFGGGGGIANAGLGLTTAYNNSPVVGRRSDNFDDTKFIRSVLRMGVNTPQIAPDAAGRWMIHAGNYGMPTAVNASGKIIINTDETARVAYGGVVGTIIGSLLDLCGLEMLPHKVVSRRAYGVMGKITRITGAGGGTTTQDVIINNSGIHPATLGDDGEYSDVYRYDPSSPTFTGVVLGGEIGLVRRQINRSDGLVATGNSGLWVGGTNYVLEGDSVEEAITKLDNQIQISTSSSGWYEEVYSVGSIVSGNDETKLITHNLGANVNVQVIQESTGEEVESLIYKVDSNSVNICVTSSGESLRVICSTNNAV